MNIVKKKIAESPAEERAVRLFGDASFAHSSNIVRAAIVLADALERAASILKKESTE